MPIDRVTNFASAGLNSDIMPSELSGEHLTYCKNLRSKNGGIVPFGGYSEISDLPANKEPRDMIYISGSAGNFWIVACDDDVLKIEATVESVKPDDQLTTTAVSTWSMTSLSAIPIINNDNDKPYYLSPISNKFIALPWDKDKDWHTANQSCKLMVAHKQFLFALGIVDNGVFVSDGIRWSAPADKGGVPPTWDPLDTTSTAGYVTLGGVGGPIVAALPMRDSLVIYREHGISVLDFVGGRYIWRIRHLESSVGAISKDAVVDINGIHYFISDGDIYMTDGNSVTSIASNRIINDLSNINSKTYKKTYVVNNPINKEALFCLPIGSSDFPNFAYIYNYRDKSWLTRELPENRKMQYGLSAKPSNSWDTLKDTWDSFSRSWSGSATSPFDSAVVAIKPATSEQPAKLISIESIIGFKKYAYDSIIERTDYTIGGVEQVLTVQKVFPHIQGDTKVMIQIGSQQYPGGSIDWKPAVEFDPRKQRKIDVRSTGQLHAYRITAKNITGDFKLTGLDFEYVGAGRR